LIRPVYGVIFLFKWIPHSDSGGHGGDDDGSSSREKNPVPQDGTYDSTATEEKGVFFAAQTIQNACGTQAILSVILNQDRQEQHEQVQHSTSMLPAISIGPELASFKDFTTGFPPELRGEALSNSEIIRSAHNAFARASPFVDETTKDPNEPSGDVYHFIAYTPVKGTLYELDGLQPYPISHGGCTPDTFPDKVIEVLQRRIARYPPDEIRFNLMAVVQDLRIRATEFGDTDLLERENRKRAAWAWENSLRRTNFVGFIGEVLKGVVAYKGQQGKPEAYREWVEAAKKETKRKLEMKRGGG
jgi:ubiquitin carboxyl-terminal hydrolase L5